jgi:DNA-binding transcriptional regulator YiaG
VRKLRKKFGMNASQFAKLLGVSPPTVTNWEKGSDKLNLRQRTMDALTRVAELTPEQAMRELQRKGSRSTRH